MTVIVFNKTSGYQWEGKAAKDQDRVMGLRVQTTTYKRDEQQGCIVLQSSYNHYFVVTFSGVPPINY